MNAEKKQESVMIKAKDAKLNFGARGWLLIIAGMICMFMAGTGKNDSLNVIMPEFSQAYGLDTATMSVIGTALGYVAAVIMIFIGWIANKVGVKKVVIVCGLLMVAGIATYNYVNSIATFALAFFLIVVGEVGIGPYGIPMLIQNWFPTKKGLAISWANAGNNLGSIFIVWLLTGSWALFGLRGGFWPWALIGLVGVLLILFFIREYPEQHGLLPDNDHTITREQADAMLKEGLEYVKTSPFSVKKLLKTKQTWMIGLGCGLLDMGGIGVIVFMVSIFMSKGFSETQSMLAMSAAAILSLPLGLLLGLIDSKMGTRKASMFVVVLSALSLLVLCLPYKWTAIIGAVGCAGLMGMTNDLVASLTSSIFGRYDFRKAFTVLYPIYCILQSSGLAVVGVLQVKTGGFTVPFIVLAVCDVLAFLLFYKLKDECIGRTDMV